MRKALTHLRAYAFKAPACPTAFGWNDALSLDDTPIMLTIALTIAFRIGQYPSNGHPFVGRTVV
jgi:hypothetical protein